MAKATGKTSRPKGRGIDYMRDYRQKEIAFPDGFVLVVDTREQRPLLDRLPKGLLIKSGTLHDGDYSILGFEHSFAIERKGISDLWTYCARDRDKTVDKMYRLGELDFAGLVIEASEAELLVPQDVGKYQPETVRQALVSFNVRFGVHIYYNRDRVAIARWILDRAVKYYCLKKEA